MSIFDRQDQTAEPLCIFGPRNGYTPQIGVLVSQLNWMRKMALSRLQNLSVEELDWVPHPDANSIGALLIHLAAFEIYYGLNTFSGVPWDDRFPHDIRKKWGVAINLGQAARVKYRSFDLNYYLSNLSDVREQTLSELSKRDDDWLMRIDATWSWGPTNNLCKWFHVCEHESHHFGQIALLLKELPRRRGGDEHSLQKS